METIENLLNKSFKFLSYRPRSEKEVRDYLVKKKADDLTLERIIKNLTENNFINDINFTKWWIEQRTKFRPKAVRIIKLELFRKGIAKDLIEEILQDKTVETETDLDKARKLAIKRIERYKSRPDGIWASLAQRGRGDGFLGQPNTVLCFAPV